jgi:RNA polymerase sigma-70 factor (ECF subfamily)
MDPESDEALAAEMARGDTAALQALYDRYEGPAYRFLFRLTGEREAAKDLMQETFTRVWTMARMFDPQRGRFKSWLFTIALNLTRNERSKKRYSVRHVGPEAVEGMAAGGEAADVALVRAETRRRVSEAMEKLPPMLREVVVMKVHQQLKFTEIAEITRTPEGTLKARFHRAVEELRRHLGTRGQV